MVKPSTDDKPGGRVSPTSPESKSLSAGVWDHLEHNVPGFNEAMETGISQIKAGKTTTLKETRRGR
jgi:hypothetical protein